MLIILFVLVVEQQSKYIQNPWKIPYPMVYDMMQFSLGKIEKNLFLHISSLKIAQKYIILGANLFKLKLKLNELRRMGPLEINSELPQLNAERITI